MVVVAVVVVVLLVVGTTIGSLVVGIGVGGGKGIGVTMGCCVTVVGCHNGGRVGVCPHFTILAQLHTCVDGSNNVPIGQ